MDTPINVNEIRIADLRLAFFTSSKELRKARSLFREDNEFKGIPWDDSPPLSLVMPSKITPLLQKRGICFKIKKPVTKKTLTPKQRKAWKKDKAILVQFLFLGLHEVTFFLERVSGVYNKGDFYVKTQKI